MTYRQFLLLAFVANGLSGIGAKAVGQFGLTSHIPLVLASMYVVGALLCLAMLCIRQTPLQPRSAVVGLLGAAGSVAGSGCLILSASLIPGYVAFPISSGGTLILVALIGRLAFREKIGVYGILGIVSGAAGIALLSSV